MHIGQRPQYAGVFPRDEVSQSCHIVAGREPNAALVAQKLAPHGRVVAESIEEMLDTADGQRPVERGADEGKCHVLGRVIGADDRGAITQLILGW